MTSPGLHILFSLLGISMDFVEHIRVGQERAEAGVGAEQDRPAAVFSAWVIRGIGVAEYSSAEGNELFRAMYNFQCH